MNEPLPLRLRTFEDADYSRFAEIKTATDPDYPLSLELARYYDSVWDERRFARFRLTAETTDGQVVGFGQFSHMPDQFHPDKYWLDCAVDPPVQRRGVGSTLYEKLLTMLRERHALLMRTQAKQSMEDSVAFLTHRGFAEVETTWESRLDVPTFAFARFAGAEERVTDQGITITTLSDELARDPAILPHVYAMHIVCERGMPAIDPITDMSFEDYLNYNVQAPNALGDAYFLAKDGDAYVGESFLFRSDDLPGVLFQGLTGVLPEYRGKGIAMALKLRGVRYAGAQGNHEIRTDNNTLNRPMLRINEAMGFVKQPVWITFQRELG